MVYALFIRHGGGSGEGDIRKLAYFEQSIDPEYSGNKVGVDLFFGHILVVITCTGGNGSYGAHVVKKLL